jgi:hypothetical protein
VGWQGVGGQGLGMHGGALRVPLGR